MNPLLPAHNNAFLARSTITDYALRFDLGTVIPKMVYLLFFSHRSEHVREILYISFMC